MKSGLKRPRKDHRDRDLLKSFGVAQLPQFPAELNLDAGFWCPNQNVGDSSKTPIILPMPYGCTDYGCSDPCSDEDKLFFSPVLLEEITHANARGGIDIREALEAAKKIFGRTGYYTIRQSGMIDMFDSMRLAMLSSPDEKRVVIVGTPVWSEFFGSAEILPTPQDFSLSRATWHCWNVKGWKTINGVPYLICKMWTGQFYLMSRELCNVVFNIRGSCAYTLTKQTPTSIQTIDVNFIQFVVSFINNILKKYGFSH